MEANHLLVKQFAEAVEYLLMPVIKLQHHLALHFTVFNHHGPEATPHLRCVKQLPRIPTKGSKRLVKTKIMCSQQSIFT